MISACCLNIQSSRTLLWSKKDVYLVDKAQSDPAATTYFAGPQPTYSKAKGRELSNPQGSRASWEWGPLTHQSRRESRPPGKQLSQWEWPSGDSSPPHLVTITHIRRLWAQDQTENQNCCIKQNKWLNTCGCNAVKSHKGIKAGGGTCQCPAKAIRKKSPCPVVTSDISSVWKIPVRIF